MTPIDGGILDEAEILVEPYLQYYYRFEDLGPFPTDQQYTPDFVPDSSGKPGNRNLTAVNQGNRLYGAGAVFVSDPDSPILPTFAGDTAQFNYLEFQWSVWGWQLGLIAQHDLPMEYPFHAASPDLPVGTGSKFQAWLAYIPPAVPPDQIRPWSDFEIYPSMPVISTWARDLGLGNRGAQLGFAKPSSWASPGTGILYYVLGADNASSGFAWESSGSYGSGVWVHFCSAIEKTAPARFRRRIWIDDTIELDLEGDESTMGDAYTSGAPLSFGTSHDDDIRMGHGRGMVEDVAYFSYSPNRESWGIIAQ